MSDERPTLAEGFAKAKQYEGKKVVNVLSNIIELFSCSISECTFEEIWQKLYSQQNPNDQRKNRDSSYKKYDFVIHHIHLMKYKIYSNPFLLLKSSINSTVTSES